MPTDRSSAGYPALLIPDADWLAANLSSDSSYTALYPIPGQPEPLGDYAFALTAHGTQGANGSLTVTTQQGGIVGPEGASFVWQNTGGTETYGWDAPTVLTGWRSVVWSATNAVAAPCIISLLSGVLLGAYARGTTGNTCYSYTRAVGGTISTPAAVAIGTTGAACTAPALVQLPSGKVLLFVAIADNAIDTATIRMMYSDDDGATWALGSSGVLPTVIATDSSTGYLFLRARAAYANGQILLVVSLRNYDTAEDYRDEIRQYASSDGGHTFSLIWSSDRSLTGSNQLGGTSPDIAVVDGSFFVVWVDFIDNLPKLRRLESAYTPLGGITAISASDTSEPWATASAGPTGYYHTSTDCVFVADETGVLYITGRQPTVGQQWIIAKSADLGATWSPMARSALSSGGGKWWDASDTGTYPAEAAGCWARGRLIVAASHQSNPATYDGGSISLYALGGWSSATMPGYDAWRVDTRQVTWGQTWLPLDLPGDSGWTRSVVGVPTDAVTTGLLVLTVAPTQSLLYHVVPAGTVAGGCIVMAQLTRTGGNPLVTLQTADVGEGYKVTIDIGATTLTVTDAIAATTIDTATVSGEVAILASITAGVLSVWYRSAVTDALESQRTWIELVAGHALTDDAGGTITANRVQWGHSATGSSTWRQVCWIDDGSASYVGTGLGSANFPADLLGRRYSGVPTYLDSDTAIAATGGPTYIGEEWTIEADYEQGPANLHPEVSPSPQLGAVFDPSGSNVLIWDFHSDDTGRLGRPLAFWIASTNLQTATLAGYDGSWDTLASISTAITTGATYARSGKAVTVTSGGTLAYVARNDLAGGSIDLGGGKVRTIRSNTEGQLGATTSTGAILILDDVDETEGVSGTCTVYGPGCCYIVAQPKDYRRFRLTIPATTTPSGTLRIGKILLGSLFLLPHRPASGREITYEPQYTGGRIPGGVRSFRRAGPMIRRVSLPFSDLMDTSGAYASAQAPDYVKLSSAGVAVGSHHGQPLSLIGLLTELQGGFCVWLPYVQATASNTTAYGLRYQSSIYGRIVEGFSAKIPHGHELTNAAYTIDGIVIEEEP